MPYVPEVRDSLVGSRPLGFTKLNMKALRQDMPTHSQSVGPVNNSDYTWHIQLFQKTLSEEKQKIFKPRPQGNKGCFKSVFCWQTITPLNWSLIFIRHLHWTILIILVFKICFKSFPTFRSPLTYRKTFHTVLRDILAWPFGLGLKAFCFSSDNVFWNNCIHLI